MFDRWNLRASSHIGEIIVHTVLVLAVTSHTDPFRPRRDSVRTSVVAVAVEIVVAVVVVRDCASAEAIVVAVAVVPSVAVVVPEDGHPP